MAKKSKVPKKEKKLTPKQLQDLIWIECRRIIHKKYPPVCYTCGATGLVGMNKQTGHMIPKGYLNAYLKFDLRLLRPQCMRCNIHMGGNGALFIENMRWIEGDSYVDDILKELDSKVNPKKLTEWYSDLLEEYKQL